jgi:hypothetical protein
MSDGRSVISSWQPESVTKKIIKENDIKSNWMYRKYLTKILYLFKKQNFKEALNDTGYINNELKTANNGLLTRTRSTTMTTPRNRSETIEAI